MATPKNKTTRNSIASKGCRTSKYCKEKIKGVTAAVISVVAKIFKRSTKVIQGCSGFALIRFVIGLENTRHFLSQSDLTLRSFRSLAPRVVSKFLPRGLIFCSCYFPMFRLAVVIGFGFMSLKMHTQVYVCKYVLSYW